jgi:cyclase
MRARKSVGEGEMTRLISCTLGVVLAGLAGAALAQQSPPSAEAALALAPAPEQVKDLGRGVYVITGALDNTTVVVGPTGLIVVDDQFAPRYPAIMEKISAISPKPIIYLINTHYHGDHTGSNAQFRQHGVRILAHANVAARLRNPPPDPITGRPAPPAPPEAIPEVTYSGVGTTINAGGITAELVHPAPAHTDGDSVVIFPAQDLILTGDLTGNHYPNIDVAVGGGIDGTLRAVDMIIARCGEHTRVVPGHGPVLTKADVIRYRAMLQTARDRIAKAKAGGMSESQVMVVGLLADLDPIWKLASNASSSRFPINVYRSLP